MIHSKYFISLNFFLSIYYSFRFVLCSDKCDFAVSLTSKMKNSQCRELCNSKSSDFDANCFYAEFNRNSGRPNARNDKCFGSYVPGYIDEAFISATPRQLDKLFTDLQDYEANRSRLGMTANIGLYKLGPNNFIECQELCQNDTNCAYFLFRLAPKVSTAKDARFTELNGCLLKSRQAVKEAFDIKFNVRGSFVVPSTGSSEFCNLGIGSLCFAGGYECKACGGVDRCVWKGYYFISGPQYCPQTFEFCEPEKAPPKSSTSAPPPTRPTTQSTSPTTRPTTQPTSTTTRPTTQPTSTTTRPTTQPTTRPTTQPTTRPTTQPTTRPTTQPTSPTTRPTTQPTSPTTRPTTQSTPPSTSTPSNDWTTARPKPTDPNKNSTKPPEPDDSGNTTDAIPKVPKTPGSKKSAAYIAPAVAGIVGAAAALGLLGMHMMSSPPLQEGDMYFENDDTEYLNDETRNLVANVDNTMFT